MYKPCSNVEWFEMVQMKIKVGSIKIKPNKRIKHMCLAEHMNPKEKPIIGQEWTQ